jgi:cytidine deaminase
MTLKNDVALLALVGLGLATSASTQTAGEQGAWTLTEAAAEHVSDPALRARIFAALDAAAAAGTDPSISHYHVRAGTVVEDETGERVIVGGNSEYAGYPEAIHGETSLMNHVISAVGPSAARREVDFIAFYSERCGGGGSCGDCRDYLMTTTRWRDLLMVCGQASDHSVHVHRFARWVVPEESFPEVAPEATGLEPAELAKLVEVALDARAGGVSLFTTTEEHLGVAALTTDGELHRAAGADDAAFHYRYPVGAVLQQAAAYRNYFVRAVVVVGAPGRTPRVSYRDRQYGYEFSSFNQKRGLPPIRLILVEEPAAGAAASARRYRMTSFEEALPGAFSAASFMPEAVDRFLEERARP